MLQHVVQHPTGGTKEAYRNVALVFLTSIARYLISNSSSDLIILATSHATKACGLPDHVGKELLRTMLKYQNDHDIWPAGFMPRESEELIGG